MPMPLNQCRVEDKHIDAAIEATRKADYTLNKHLWITADMTLGGVPKYVPFADLSEKVKGETRLCYREGIRAFLAAWL